MEITKEKFIQFFKDECSKAVESLEEDSFTGTKELLEIICTQNISASIVKNTIIRTLDKPESYTYSGQIILDGWVQFSEYGLLEEEYNELEDYYEKCRDERTTRLKKSILEKGRLELSSLIS